MRTFTVVASALSDENRVRALLALRHGELCVCQIVELLALAPSTVSKHMSILRDAGLAAGRKEGRWMYYRLEKQTDAPAGRMLALLRKSLEADKQIKADDKRLQVILRENKEDLCRRQMGRAESGGKGCCS